MDFIIKILDVDISVEEINNIIDKISQIPALNEVGANINTETIIREFVEKKEN